MGCASSASAHTNVIVSPSRSAHAVYPTAHVAATTSITNTIVVKNIPDAPKPAKGRKDSSSSSSSSDSDSLDLDRKRKLIKEASALAATITKKKEVILNVETLRRYNSLTVVIVQLERKNVVQRMEEKARLSIELKNQAVKLNDEYKQLQMKTQKEFQDVQNLQSLAKGENVFKYFQSKVEFDTQTSKEQEEYIQAKTEMEDCYKRLVAIQVRQAKIETEISVLRVDHEELTKHYKEQDEILDSIFGGSYGSELEDRLEGELDKQLEKKQRIEVASQRWRYTQTMVAQASTQLHYAYDRWQSILRIPYNTYQHKMLRLQVAAEVRNYLIAASQNLTAANRTLTMTNVKLPYCDMAEIQTLNKAISYIFIDVQDKARHSHAGNVYKTTRDRCFVLSQWVDLGITTTVQKYLTDSRKQCSDLQKQLRAERSRLMREKIEEETGEKVVLEDEPGDSGVETDEDSEVSDMATEAEKFPEADDLDKQIKEAQQETAEGEEGETAEADDDNNPVPLPLNELAPAPKQDELFGNLEVVMADYDKQRDEYAKEIEANRARQQADFQMKLKARRSRKRRMMAQENELNELMQKEKDTTAIEIPTEN